ncbi:acyltransferase [Buttiauxella gaviniae]|uniref:Acyltransferase n=1 Tax=Buttiauxella gaviniae TaxID=82990 RepID=A0ABV3NXX6_9ENTR
MKSVSDVLKRDNNNFDLLRIFCAIMVIFAHSYYLSNANGAPEPLQSLLPFTYTGSVAVKIFFFISGLLVTNSLISNKSTIHFLVSRFFRIYPAFIFVILFTAIVVGPIVTSLDIASYFSNPLTVDYIKNSSVFDMAFMLPGVFDANIYKGSVNGSLWTIPYEVASYAVLLGCFLLTENKNKYISSLICLIVIISPITGWNRFLFINSDNADVYLMAPCFALGALFAIHKEKN